MPASPQAVELIAGFEGFRAKPYLCPAGRWTIGYGSTRLLDGSPVTEHTPPVTKAQASTLMLKTLGPVADFIDSLVQVPTTDPQEAALQSFVYNVGQGSFETSTLLQKLNAGDYLGAGEEFLRWNRGGGKVLPGLTVRRETESRLFLSAIPAANDVDAPDSDVA